MKRTWVSMFAMGAVVVLFAAACSSSSDSSGDNNTTSTTKEAKAEPSATAEPTTDLTEGQEVSVSAEGFTPGLSLGINECAELNDDGVGGDDCNLGGIGILEIGDDGTGTGTIAVISTDIGANAHDCSNPDTRCFLSVGELIPDDDAERAPDIGITFAS